jgi:hypothetical protein
MVVTKVWLSMCGYVRVIRTPARSARYRSRRVAAGRSIRVPRVLSRAAARLPTAGGRGSRHIADAIMGYHREVCMTDVLIRDVPDEVIAAVDARAGRLGLSRSEYVRRRLAQDASAPGSPVSARDLARFAEVFADLADPDVMSGAWQ